MTTYLSKAALMAAAALVMVTPANAAVTFDFANVFAATEGSASRGSALDEQQDDQQIQSDSFPTGTLTVSSASRPFLVGVNGDANADTSLVLNSVESGTFDFNSTSNAFVGAGVSDGFLSAEAYYIAGDYGFTIDTASTFAFDFEVFGYNNFNNVAPTLTYFLSGGTFFDTADLTGTGSRSFTLEAGSYTFSLVHNLGNNGGLVEQTGPGFVSSASYSTVDFTIADATAAVPEPASWALMIGGFGLVGGAMRRRTASIRAFA